MSGSPFVGACRRDLDDDVAWLQSLCARFPETYGLAMAIDSQALTATLQFG